MQKRNIVETRVKQKIVKNRKKRKKTDKPEEIDKKIIQTSNPISARWFIVQLNCSQVHIQICTLVLKHWGMWSSLVHSYAYKCADLCTHMVDVGQLCAQLCT